LMMGEFIPHAEHGGFLHPYPKVKIIDIVAQRFPSDYLQIRDEFMKSQKKITLTYTHFYHVIRKVPRYRYLRIGRPMSSNR